GHSIIIPPIQPSPEPFGGSRIFTRLKSQALSTADSIFNEIKTHKTATAVFAGASGVLAVLLFLPAGARLVNKIFDPQPTWTMTQFTNSGTSVAAALSPDGKLVAHVEEQNGRQGLVVTISNMPGSFAAVRPEDNV